MSSADDDEYELVTPEGDVTFLRVPVKQPQIDPRLTVWGAGGDTPHTFHSMRQGLAQRLLETDPFNRGQWQTLDVAGSELHATHELLNVSLFYTVPDGITNLQLAVRPDLPWAEIHHTERVGRQPLNPAPSYLRWPHHGGDDARHIDADGGSKFSHTYPERFWPKRANQSEIMQFPNGRSAEVNCGIRYAYGDLDDVVGQLCKNPHTRQAVLPMWFPEDTGATDRRVPCTLSYHFMADRHGRLSVWYAMRACDFVRHFHNDVYFAGRLLQWVIAEVAERGGQTFTIGELNMNVSNLHAFVGDRTKLESIAEGV